MENDARRTIEYEPSKSAMGVTFLRAVAAVDAREEIRGRDDLAHAFLAGPMRDLFEDCRREGYTTRAFHFSGAYEYILARTAFFDHAVERALRDGVPQIVIMGAGYDSRAYRFGDLANETRIFELDVPSTQRSKRELLDRAGIAVPDHLVFVPIDFGSESLADALRGAGFSCSRRTLLVWEGVTMYLSDEAVDDVLRFIRSELPPGSAICFDYHSLWPEMFEAYAVRDFWEFHDAHAPGEPFRFGIGRGMIEPFMAERGLVIVDHLTAADMEKRFLTLRDGSIAGRIPALFCFVHASVPA